MCPGNTFGAACERNVCAGTPPCNANGKCVIAAPIDAATGVAVIGVVPEPRCECFEGYRGLDCSLADCKGGCSGRGKCLGGLGPRRLLDARVRDQLLRPWRVRQRLVLVRARLD